MEGAALAAKRAYDLAISQAWHTAIFALNGYAGKLKGKSLSDYLSERTAPRRSKFADASAFFGRLKAAGVRVDVSRTPRRPS